jgi:hypothetical protein
MAGCFGYLRGGGMTNETRQELHSITSAVDHFWRIEDDKDTRDALYEVIVKLEAIYENANATV